MIYAIIYVKMIQLTSEDRVTSITIANDTSNMSKYWFLSYIINRYYNVGINNPFQGNRRFTSDWHLFIAMRCS